MATLQQLIDLYPTRLFKCTDGVSEYQYSQFIRNGNAVMYDGSEHALDEDKWELYREPLEDCKAKRILEIDYKTRQLIDVGFTFDGQSFSLSSSAQLNWVGMKASMDILSFPVSLTTKDDISYDLSQANALPFLGLALSAKQAHLDSGRSLKVSIKGAATYAVLDAIVDAR